MVVDFTTNQSELVIINQGDYTNTTSCYLGELDTICHSRKRFSDGGDEIPSGSLSSCSTTSTFSHTNDNEEEFYSTYGDDSIAVCRNRAASTSNDEVEKVSNIPLHIDIDRSTRKVRFALADAHDDSSLLAPSCIYRYENDREDEHSESDLATALLSYNENTSDSHQPLSSLDNTRNEEWWWSDKEEDEMYKDVTKQCRILRIEHRDFMKRMLRCYDDVAECTSDHKKRTNTEEFMKFVSQWVSISLPDSTTRGLESFVCKKFKKERKQTIQSIIRCYHANKRIMRYESSHGISVYTIEDLVRLQSVQLSQSTCKYAHLLALADADEVARY